MDSTNPYQRYIEGKWKTVDIPEFIEAAIADCTSRLSEQHRALAKSALEASWKLGGLCVEERDDYRYVASWKLHLASRTWIATIYVAVEEARATCPAARSDLVGT